jgi:hypothetical protein
LTEQRDHFDDHLPEDLRKVSAALDRLAQADAAGFDPAMQERIAASLKASHAQHQRGLQEHHRRRWRITPMARLAASLLIIIGVGAAWLALRTTGPSRVTSERNGTLARGGGEGTPTDPATPGLAEELGSTESTSAAEAWASLDALYEDDPAIVRTASEDAEQLWRALGEHATNDPLAGLFTNEESGGAL